MRGRMVSKGCRGPATRPCEAPSARRGSVIIAAPAPGLCAAALGDGANAGVTRPDPGVTNRREPSRHVTPPPAPKGRERGRKPMQIDPSPASAGTHASPPADAALQREIAALIVEALHLETAPGEITADQPLYGEGLGLDSIDILEIALVVSRKYGFQLRSDDEDNVRIFASLGSLAAHIAANRTK